MVEKYKCVGCVACVSICPTNALYMERDKEGFNYPILDQNKCISCNACKRVCPVLEIEEKIDEEATFYAMKSKNYNIQINSASGGAFPEIARWILRGKGIVWGAKFDSNFDVRHGYIVSENELSLLCRSKYVQSDMTNVYNSIKRQLSDGKKVLFSGTPCQTTALAKFVGEKLRSNLYLVDIVCHGVPSPSIWQEYLDELCKQKSQRKEDIIQICFKYKNNEKTWLHPGFYVKWKDGTEYLDFSDNTWYEKGFLGNLYVRPSCHECVFKSLRSISDMTIGDFWGCKELYPDLFDINGVSLVIVKTKKGEYIKKKITDNMNFILISKNEACKYNSRLTEPSQKNFKKQKFWEKYNDLDKNVNNMEKLIEELTYFSFYDRIKNKILRLLKNKR